MKTMTIRMHPGTRLHLGEGHVSDYGAVLEVAEDIGRALTTGPNPSADEVPTPEPPARTRREPKEE